MYPPKISSCSFTSPYLIPLSAFFPITRVSCNTNKFWNLFPFLFLFTSHSWMFPRSVWPCLPLQLFSVSWSFNTLLSPPPEISGHQHRGERIDFPSTLHDHRVRNSTCRQDALSTPRAEFLLFMRQTLLILQSSLRAVYRAIPSSSP